MSKKPTIADIITFAMRDSDEKLAAKRAARIARMQLEKTRLPIADASRATHHVTDHAQSYGLAPLKHNEFKSIYSLFAWVANKQGAAEETVQSMTEARFGVDDVTKLQQKDYEEVIRFLVDLRIDELCH